MLYKSRLFFTGAVFSSFLIVSCSGGNAESGNLNSEACTAEFTFSIGEIDSRFGITRSEVQDAMNSALEIWDVAFDSLITAQSESGRNTIQLIYDERQNRADRARQFQERLFNLKQSVERLQQEYEQSQVRVERQREQYQVAAERLRENLTSFNAWVEEANQSGGLTEDQVPRYESELETIRQLQQTEQRLRSDLERMITDFNQLTDRVNRQVDAHNEQVQRFNELFGEEFHFTGAHFESDGRRGTITVYHFQDRRELILLLAHEIGHALNIDHVENSKSVMYPIIMEQMNEPILQLTAEDIEAARQHCR